ncbi:MAG: acetyl-CoA carboxylase carboxyltransferase subunit alpha [Rhodobacteraceae bacterium]|nr:acetyl-CoA carboxylase carboxyltransferase subunit alpha [Paracoccaceae bacterium]MCY4327339.1 acetyl-CoA carboxylase carboxyltransferase subunit alpha [Paracoccaceae bacterium]
MRSYLEFEKPLAEIEAEADQLRAKNPPDDSPDGHALKSLDARAQKVLEELYSDLNPWRKCQVARHENRPRCKDYLRFLFTDRVQLAGDRAYADDTAIIGCLARFEDRPVMVIGQEKGHDITTRVHHNFGMARPEGYRKAIRLMDLADRFHLPVITLVDTSGAYPGKGAEERGQAEAIARSTERCLQLKSPLLSVVIGEGGSGGAIALASGDRTAMLSNSVYSVISPEGCASILWQDAEKMREAAEQLRLTAQDLVKLGVVDEIIDEPPGGAQRHQEEVIENVGRCLSKMLAELTSKSPETLQKERHARFMAMGDQRL